MESAQEVSPVVLKPNPWSLSPSSASQRIRSDAERVPC